MGRVEPQGGNWAMKLDGKTILITGSTVGVGRKVALELGAAGATVLIHGRNHERAESVVDEIARRGGKAVFYPADLSSLERVHRLASAVIENHDRLHVLINNAGIGTA